MEITKFQGSVFEKQVKSVYAPLIKAKRKYDAEYSKIYKGLDKRDEKEIKKQLDHYTKVYKKLNSELKSLEDPILKYEAVIKSQYTSAQKELKTLLKAISTSIKTNKEEYIKEYGEAKKIRGGSGSIKGAAAGARDSVEGILSKLNAELKKRSMSK